MTRKTKFSIRFWTQIIKIPFVMFGYATDPLLVSNRPRGLPISSLDVSECFRIVLFDVDAQKIETPIIFWAQIVKFPVGLVLLNAGGRYEVGVNFLKHGWYCTTSDPFQANSTAICWFLIKTYVWNTGKNRHVNKKVNGALPLKSVILPDIALILPTVT